MSKSDAGRTLKGVIFQDRLDTNIESFLGKILSRCTNHSKNQTVPTLIALSFISTGTTKELSSFRKFLNALKRFQETHFVRFVMDSLWVAQSHGGDCFYTFDDVHPGQFDLDWDLYLDDAGRIRVSSSPDISTKLRRKMIRLAHDVKDYVEGSCISDDRKEILSYIDHIYSVLYEKHLGFLDGMFIHTIIIGSLLENEETLILSVYPILGLRMVDSERRARICFTKMYDYQLLGDFIPFKEIISPPEVKASLIEALDGVVTTSDNTMYRNYSYPMAELLLSHIAVEEFDDTDGNGNTITFIRAAKLGGTEEADIDVFNVNMCDITKTTE